MRRRTLIGLAAATMVATTVPAHSQDGLTVGMSWANYHEERWKIDEAGLQEALDEMGAELVTADAQSSNARQASDIEGLLARGIDVLAIVAWGSEAIIPSVEKALAEGVPVIAYERQIEHPGLPPISTGQSGMIMEGSSLCSRTCLCPTKPITASR